LLKTHILIIEDDEEIARLTSILLGNEGYTTSIVSDGGDAIEQIKQLNPDLILLDLMLPTLSGDDICKQAREFYDGPILIVTASNDDISEVHLLDIGADDYLRKPIKPKIMSARIKALLRRFVSDKKGGKKIVLNSIEIDCHNRSVKYLDKLLELTNSEYDMLVILANHAGEIVSRESCSKALRGIDYDLSDRSIDMRISALRKKLTAQTQHSQLIKTIRNKGYILTNE